MQKYFVVEPGASPHGPYAETMVKRAFEHRMYPPGTKVWWEGAPEWVPIEAIFGSKTQYTVPPPPPRVEQANYTHSVRPSFGWNVINAFTSNMKRYTFFEGRSCKSEYWYYQLACLIMCIFSMCFGEIGFAVVYILMNLVLFVPNMALSYRRLQDAGYNGTAGAVISGIFDVLGLITILAEGFLPSDLAALVFIIVLGCMPSKNVSNPHGAAPLRPI